MKKIALDATLIKQAETALRDIRARKLNAVRRAAVVADLAANFVAESNGLEGYITTPAEVRKAAEQSA